jgi:hypothetical protein
VTEPIQKDPAAGHLAYCNDPSLDERCPVCLAEPGFRCRYVGSPAVGQPMSHFHRARIALTYRPTTRQPRTF